MQPQYCLIKAILFGFMAISAAGRLVAEDSFAVSPIYSLRPDGVCQEITGGSFGQLAHKNQHWNADTKSIKLVAARNEEAAMQLVLPRVGKAFAGSMSDLVGPGLIPANRVTLSALLWVMDSKGKLSPDLVIPLDGTVNGIRTFDVPIRYDGLPNAQNVVGTMLLEIWIPKTAAAGLYNGTLKLLSGESAIETLNIEVTVLDFTLPDAPTFAFDLLDYGMPAEDLGIRGSLNGDGLGKREKKCPRNSRLPTTRSISWLRITAASSTSCPTPVSVGHRGLRRQSQARELQHRS